MTKSSRALHPDVQALLASGPGAFSILDTPVQDVRALYSKARQAARAHVTQVAAVETFVIEGKGGTFKLRLYQGHDRGKDQPCLLYFHGGGWVFGDLESHDEICRRFASQTQASVLAVEYRLAPEHPFPAALEDGEAALRWLAQNAARLGIDQDRLAVGGDSAGGSIAASLALMARDGSVPAVVYQLLLYPVLDLAMGTDSYRRVKNMPHTAEHMRYFLDMYVPNTADRSNWKASPAAAKSLKGAPSALILTCGHDPLEEEGRLYARRLEEAGVAVTALHLSDQTHGILNVGPAIGAAASIIDFAAAMLSDAWRFRPAKPSRARP